MSCAKVISQIEVLPAGELGRRRAWSNAEKIRIVEESYRGHRQGSVVARRYGISRPLLTQWRRAYRKGLLDGGRPVFTPVEIGPDPDRRPLDRRDEPDAVGSGPGAGMIAFPAGTRVWIAGGVTHMRGGMNSLALKVQQGLGRDPQSGEIFCFRGRKADMVKLLWFDGVGMSLYAKRLEAGKFVWPSSTTTEAVAISAAQLGYLLDGIDWRNPRWTQRPKKMG